MSSSTEGIEPDADSASIDHAIRSRLRFARLVAALLGLPAVIVWGAMSNDVHSPVAGALVPALLGGLLGLIVSSSVALRSRRMLAKKDAVRIISWAFIGLGLGKHLTVDGYYDHFNPGCYEFVNLLTFCALGFGSAGIVTSCLWPMRAKRGT